MVKKIHFSNPVNLYCLDSDHTFEDRLEVLLQRLKEYQTLGKEIYSIKII